MEYTPGADAERIHHVEFIHLLCLLADGEKTNLSYTRGEEEEAHRTPLEIALDNMEKLKGSLEKESLEKMKNLIKIQAVAALVRSEEKEAAKDLLATLWPKQLQNTTEDKEAVKNLTNMIAGKENKAFDEAHTHQNFCQSLMPTLKKIHDQFKEPFLLKIMTKKKAMDKRMASPKRVTCSQLKKMCGPRKWNDVLDASDKMAKEAKASTSHEDSSSSTLSSPQMTPRKSQRYGRSVTSSSVSEEEFSPAAKRGKSIRSLKYGHRSKPAPAPSAAKANSGSVDLDSLMDSDSEDALRDRISDGKSLPTPKVKTTLRDITDEQGLRKERPRKRPSEAKRRPWTQEEEEELVLGIRRYGIGKWAEINLAYNFNNRSNVQLKDKYRTMVNQGLMSS